MIGGLIPLVLAGQEPGSSRIARNAFTIGERISACFCVAAPLPVIEPISKTDGVIEGDKIHGLVAHVSLRAVLQAVPVAAREVDAAPNAIRHTAAIEF